MTLDKRIKWALHNQHTPEIEDIIRQLTDIVKVQYEALGSAPIVTLSDNLGTVREKLSYWHCDKRHAAMALSAPIVKGEE